MVGFELTCLAIAAPEISEKRPYLRDYLLGFGGLRPRCRHTYPSCHTIIRYAQNTK
jgi:hypothetical protein